MNPVTPRHIAYFRAVVEWGSFSEAARRLPIAQSALSAQVANLEAILGAPLLIRSARGVELTDAGRVVMERSRRVTVELDALVSQVKGLVDSVGGTVDVGYTESRGGLDVAGACASFARMHRGITVRVRRGLLTDLLPQLRSGELDVVVGPAYPELSRDLVATTVRADSLVAVMPDDAAHRRLVRLDVRRLGREPVVALPDGTGARTALLRLGERVGFVPDIRAEAGPVDSIRLVEKGVGIALSPLTVASATGSRVLLRPLSLAIGYPSIAVLTVREVFRSAALLMRSHLVQAATHAPAGEKAAAGLAAASVDR